MVRDQVLTSRLLFRIITGYILIAILAGCSSEYSTVGPSLEGASSIRGGDMQTIAGLSGGYGTSDGLGSDARFNTPRGIVAIGNNLYVADQNNHAIRSIDTLTGTVSTFAGYPGFPGVNDGIGMSARFNAPEGIETDGKYLYVADTKNHTIRKIEVSTGNVVTLAGKWGQNGYSNGAGADATFNGPASLTLMGDLLYVADTDSHTIRRVNKDTGYTDTIAGTPGKIGSTDGTGMEAKFNYPLGIDNDGQYLFIADTYNHMIRVLDPSTGNVFTLAGKANEPDYKDGSFGAARFSYPYGLRVVDGEVFVADYGNDVIRVLNLQNYSVGTFVGIPFQSGSTDGSYEVAKLNSPSDVDVIGDYIYITEVSNHTIRKINWYTGEVVTLAGNAPNQGTSDGLGDTSTFNTPGGIIKEGNILYVADTYNSTIRMINIITGEVSTLSGTPGVPGTADSSESPALFSSPTDIIIDESKENIYIIDTDNNVVRRMNIASGEVRTFAGYPGSAGTLDGVGRNARFNAPTRGVRSGDMLYIADTGNHVIRAVNTVTAEVTTVAGEKGESGWRNRAEGEESNARFSSPGDITTDGTFLYVADTGNHVIRIVSPLTGAVATVAGSPGSSGLLDSKDGVPLFNSPSGILWDNEILYISDTGNHVMRKIDLTTGKVSFLAGDMSCIEESTTTSGSTTTNLKCTGQPAGTSSLGDSSDGTGRTTSFNGPTAISTDGTYLYVMDTKSNSVRRVDKVTGETKTLYFTKNKGIPLKSPSGGDISGNTFYVADKGNQIIRIVEIGDLFGSPLIIIAGTVGSQGYRYSAGYSAQFNRPVGISADGNGNIYVADTGNHSIRKIVVATKEVTTLAGSPGIAGFMDSRFGSPLFNFPRGICFVADHLYVADSGNHLIRRVNIINGYVGLVAGLSDYVTNVGSPGTTDSTGAAAGFNDPRGITSDGQYLYVTDTGNHTIRKILRVTGEVKTIAGMPKESGYNDAFGFDARFTYPKGITVDGDHLYVADSGNNVIRRVNKNTGEALTFSGKKGQSSFIPGVREVVRYNNIVSMTTDSTTPYVFFTDSIENVVGKVTKE
ncbi:MAG: hypothetical protein HZA08_07140 [Nitrospirae bacterium]|nr:hypothetical protein [Nitrospirota bacterium]